MKSGVDKNLRILFLCSDKFPPYRVDVSVLFGEKMVERGHVIDWLLQSGQDCDKSYQTEWRGCKVWIGPTDNGTSKFSRFRKHLYSILHDASMFMMLRKSEYDYVIVRDKFITSIIAIIAAKIFTVKFVFWMSYPFPEAYLYAVKENIARYPYLYWVRGNLLKMLLYNIILKSADHTFVQTFRMQDDFVRKGIALRKMTPVLMGVATEDIPFWGYKTNGTGHRQKIVLYLGTLAKVRRMDFLIRTFKKVLDKEEHAVLYLVGGGEDDSDERMLRDIASRLYIEDKVLITGLLPQQTAWGYVKDAAVCVSPIRPLPILDCGSPTKLIEYMAMGKAVVANDHPEQRLVLAESRAGICVSYDEDAFAQAILYVLEHEKEAVAMGIRGRRYVEEKRSYEYLADIVEEKLLSLHQPTRSSTQKGKPI